MSSSAASELPECPLCMETFELDDLNFFPCTCGYQICRFCWHRIRTDENGLCPACRKAYPEDPAQFKPLTEDEVQRIKKDWKQKESQRKQKSAESRKHLANVRVVQKNLVFVVGLSQRLTDPEVLKRHEYFGKFGKIHKVVINQSTSYVGSQGPSASAYVTYYRPEDALAAIKVVNNLQIEGRTLKASLGTTKYCSHFLKGTQCMKPDCMYLHDYGDESASFTKEEIQSGKHLQYEQKLHEQYSASLQSHPRPPASSSPDVVTNNINKTHNNTKTHNRHDEFGGGLSSGELSPIGNQSSTIPDVSPPSSSSPKHHPDGGSDTLEDLREGQDEVPVSSIDISGTGDPLSTCSSAQPSSLTVTTSDNSSCVESLKSTLANCHVSDNSRSSSLFSNGLSMDNYSLFTDNGFTANRNSKATHSTATGSEDGTGTCKEPEIAESMPVKSNTNWQEAFGFSSDNDNQDDDLGFDPWDVSTRGLADMIESEKVSSVSAQPQRLPGPPSSNNPLPPTNGFILPPNYHTHSQMPLARFPMPWTKMLPPGFTPNGYLPPLHAGALPPHYLQPPPARSKMLNLIHQSQQQQQQQQQNAFSNNHISPPVSYPNNHQTDLIYGQFSNKSDTTSAFLSQQQSNNILNNDEMSLHKWQEGFRALLPNINISFGTPSTQAQQQQQTSSSSSSAHGSLTNSLAAGSETPAGITMNGSLQSQTPSLNRAFPAFDRTWCSSSHSMPDLSFDPAIVNTGGIADGSSYGEEPPHWMASLHHLTDDQLPLPTLAATTPTLTSPPHHLPWMSAAPHTARYPPPGFSMPRQNSEPQTEQKSLQTSALQ